LVAPWGASGKPVLRIFPPQSDSDELRLAQKHLFVGKGKAFGLSLRQCGAVLACSLRGSSELSKLGLESPCILCSRSWSGVSDALWACHWPTRSANEASGAAKLVPRSVRRSPDARVASASNAFLKHKKGYRVSLLLEPLAVLRWLVLQPPTSRTQYEELLRQVLRFCRDHPAQRLGKRASF
jgi:hypothetical protein